MPPASRIFAKPRLRGVLGQLAFLASLVAGAGLILDAGSARARIDRD
jgi:hypothetical protein